MLKSDSADKWTPSTPGGKRLVNLVDVSGFIHRAFYALPNLSTDGGEVGALYGFCMAINKVMSKFVESMYIAALDSGRKTFRNNLYPQYKANRRATPLELVYQIPLIREACERFGFMIVEQGGVEADDIIATYVKKCRDKYDINIITSDKDLLQLLGGTVSVYDPIKHVHLTEDDVFEKFGVPSHKIPDVMALAGDQSDNIPGVSGIGYKTAAILINEYGSLENLISNLDQLPRKKRYDTLRNEVDNAVLFKKLVTLKDDLDLPFKYKISKPDALGEFLMRFKFNALLKRQKQLIPERRTSEAASGKVLLYADEVDEKFLMKLRSRLEDKNVLKLCEDSKSVIKLCLKMGIAIKNTIDVSVASYCVSGTKIKHDLCSMSIAYLGDHSRNLEEIYNAIENLFDTKCKNLFFEIENKVPAVLAKMEYRGMEIDMDYLEKLGQYYREQIQKLTKQVHSIAGIEFNLASPKQVAYVLYDKLRFPRGRNTPSTDAEVLANFGDIHDGIAGKILSWRKYSKLHGTYIKPLLELADSEHRIHTTYSQTVVNTGRLSSSSPNLQNIPKRTKEGLKLRRAFVASNGCSFISFDYSQVELRLLAHMSGCAELISAFRNGEDVHIATASRIFDTQKKDVTPEQRRMAKEMNFSLIYGMSTRRAAMKFGIEKGDAESLHDSFLKIYPEIFTFMNASCKFAAQNGYVETLMGRKCFLPLIKSSNKMLSNLARRQAINAPLQGSNADLIKLAMVRINENAPCDFHILLQVHDELVVEVEDHLIPTTVDFVKATMEEVASLSVHLVVDASISKSL
ncbi:MAG: hypothetical protein LBF56_02755 [Holosporales bacterium]|jgi:DNA polymerase-1|nr:hypothetical protein [Holosporales bacterium]